MDITAFILAVLALLAAPGPTNALLAAAGAALGLRAALALVPAAIAGYLVAIVTLSLGLGGMIAAHPMVATGLKLAASLWLLRCALRLWRQGGTGPETVAAPITQGRILLTTLLNPKAVIFALVIIPRGEATEMIPWLTAFSVLTAVSAAAWIAFGAALARSAATLVTPCRVWRVTAMALAAFATIMAGTAIAGSF